MKSFEEMVLKPDGTLNLDFPQISMGYYADQLTKWFEVFNRSQIHIINGDQFITQPWIEFKKIENFLNLKHELGQHMFYFNSTKGFYCTRPNRVSGKEKKIFRLDRYILN